MHYDVTAQEFCDVLALHCQKCLLNIYSSSGAPFSLDHVLVFRNGGLIIQQHNEVRNTVGNLAALVCGQVVSDPVVRDVSVSSKALIADLNARRVWKPQTIVVFDIYVSDTTARSDLFPSSGVVSA